MAGLVKEASHAIYHRTTKNLCLHAYILNGRISSNCTEIEPEPHRVHKVVGARSTMDQHGKNAIYS